MKRRNVRLDEDHQSFLMMDDEQFKCLLLYLISNGEDPKEYVENTSLSERELISYYAEYGLYSPSGEYNEQVLLLQQLTKNFKEKI
jgi:hypothetical protein